MECIVLSFYTLNTLLLLPFFPYFVTMSRSSWVQACSDSNTDRNLYARMMEQGGLQSGAQMPAFVGAGGGDDMLYNAGTGREIHRRFATQRFDMNTSDDVDYTQASVPTVEECVPEYATKHLKTCKAESVSLKPRAHRNDICRDRELDKLNAQGSADKRPRRWKDCCNDTIETSVKFHCRFPVNPFRSKPELRFYDLVFTLPSEAMTINDYLSKCDADGSMRMRIDGKTIAAGFKEQFGGEFDLLVYHIQVINE